MTITVTNAELIEIDARRAFKKSLEGLPVSELESVYDALDTAFNALRGRSSEFRNWIDEDPCSLNPTRGGGIISNLMFHIDGKRNVVIEAVRSLRPSLQCDRKNRVRFLMKSELENGADTKTLLELLSEEVDVEQNHG